MKRQLLFPILALGLFLSACDAGDPGEAEDIEESSITMQVSGAVEGTYIGIANLQTTPVVIVGFSFENDEGFANLSREGVRPVPGTYPISENASDGNAFEVLLSLADILALPGEDSQFAMLDDGTVTITSVSETRIEGRFSGTGETLRGRQAVSASGEFVAVCQTEAQCPQ